MLLLLHLEQLIQLVKTAGMQSLDQQILSGFGTLQRLIGKILTPTPSELLPL